MTVIPAYVLNSVGFCEPNVKTNVKINPARLGRAEGAPGAAAPGAQREDNVESQRAQVGARMEVTAAASCQNGRSKVNRVGGYKMATRLPIRLKA